VTRKGCCREARSGGRVEQKWEPMKKNRIGGASAGRAGRSPIHSPGKRESSGFLLRPAITDPPPIPAPIASLAHTPPRRQIVIDRPPSATSPRVPSLQTFGHQPPAGQTELSWPATETPRIPRCGHPTERFAPFSPLASYPQPARLSGFSENLR
jgi:hypothetical protein